MSTRTPFVASRPRELTAGPSIATVSRYLNRTEVLERKRVTSAERELAALVGAIHDAVVSVDREGVITTWNAGAQDLFGFASEEMIGRGLTALMPPERMHEKGDVFDLAIEGTPVRDFETERLHRDGHRLQVAVTASPIRSGHEVVGACALMRDVSDRRQGKERLEEKVFEQTAALEVAREETLQCLALAAEYRDDETYKHTERVGRVAHELALRIGLPRDDAQRLRQAAPLHDVGKLGISDAILLKPSRLTEEEFETMKGHTVIGAGILAGSASRILQLAEEIALSHHERWDGSGYPAGLAGKEISLSGRIVAIADAFDAMVYDRPYRPALPLAVALDEIRRMSGSQFDPALVEEFLQLEHPELVQQQQRRQPVLIGC